MNPFLLAAIDGRVIVDIGQIDAETRRALDREVRKGRLVRWRGHWTTHHPDFGFGPLKTCWALPRVRDRICGAVAAG